MAYFQLSGTSLKNSNRARISFDHELKNQCYIFTQHGKDVFLVKNAEGLTHEDIEHTINDYLHDIYVVDEDFTWTYAATHEEDCGPYFYK